MPRDSAADFKNRGPRFQAAWRILERGCEVPPSLDVFEHQVTLDRRANPRLTPEMVARRIADSYHRVAGFFGDEV